MDAKWGRGYIGVVGEAERKSLILSAAARQRQAKADENEDNSNSGCVVAASHSHLPIYPSVHPSPSLIPSLSTYPSTIPPTHPHIHSPIHSFISHLSLTQSVLPIRQVSHSLVGYLSIVPFHSAFSPLHHIHANCEVSIFPAPASSSQDSTASASLLLDFFHMQLNDHSRLVSLSPFHLFTHAFCRLSSSVQLLYLIFTRLAQLLFFFLRSHKTDRVSVFAANQSPISDLTILLSLISHSVGQLSRYFLLLSFHQIRSYHFQLYLFFQLLIYLVTIVLVLFFSSSFYNLL